MTSDRGRHLEFGISVGPNAASLSDILELAIRADRHLDLIGIQDHPYQRRFLDTTTLLTAIAVKTTRLRVFHDVACLPLRHPATLAKEAASIDIISGGRFELGLGAGAFWDAIEGMGGPRRSPSEALAALGEAVQVIRLLWSGDRGVRFDGDHYSIKGIHSGPVPRHDIEIWFGVYGPKACQLLGRVADGWLPSLGRFTLEQLDSRNEIIDESAAAAGRDPTAIRRLLNVNGAITDEESNGMFNGPADRWVDDLGSLVLEHGFDTFIFWPDQDPLEQTDRFAEVAEQVRGLIDAARAS